MTSSKPIKTDNTALSIIGTCLRKYQLAVIHGLYKPKDRAQDTGDAYHKCLEHLDKGEDPTTVTNTVFKDSPGVDKAKLLLTLIQFKLSHKMPAPLVINGEPLLEKKFSFDYKYRGINFLLEGTIDRIHIEEVKDILVILDYKTSEAPTEYLITKAIREYELAFQLEFYYNALYSSILPASMVEGYLAARKYRLEMWFAFYNFSRPFKKLIRQPFPDGYRETAIEPVIQHRLDDILKVYDYESSNKSAPMTGKNVYSACSHCAFRPACQVAGTAREQDILNSYPKRFYDPMTFR